MKVLDDVVDAFFIYAFTWSLGCTTDYQGREKFEYLIKI